MKARDALVLSAVAVAWLLVAACGGKKAGMPCTGNASSCVDKKSALACRGGKLVEITCAGTLGCTPYQDHANCDTSVATSGQLCMGEDDEYACSADKKHAVLCKGGHFEPWLECRGPNGCSMLGRTPSCDVSIAEKGDPCKSQGALACSVDQKRMLVCRDGKFALHRNCRGQYGCANKGELPSCDESISLPGDPCGVPSQIACSEDGKTELICQGGVYVTSRTCKGACTVTSKPGRPIDCN